MMERILVVDNDSKTIHLLRQIFSSAGYIVISANRPDRALQLAAEDHFILIITESSFQEEMDGYIFTRRLREFSDVPVVFLTNKFGSEDILRAYEAGADDVIAKPFDSRVLLAKIKALLGRCKKIQSVPEIIDCGRLSIDQVSREVKIDDVSVYLTETEYNLLLELAKHHDQVMLHEQLLEAVWGPEYRHEMDYLRSYVHILRKKLEEKPSSPSLIVSLSGIGYKLVSAPAEKKES